MTSPIIAFNLLPYRHKHTGLSRYVERILSAWPALSQPLQLRISSSGVAELARSLQPPLPHSSAFVRRLQSSYLIQHAVPVRSLLSNYLPQIVYSPYTDYLMSIPQIPQVITCHDLTPLYFPNSRRAYIRSRFLLPQHMRRARLVVAISCTVADQLVTSGLPISQIAVVPNGVDPVKKPLTNPSSYDCLVLARHTRNKNLSLALYGYSKFLQSHPCWPGRLIVVGTSDTCTASLLRQQKELGLEGRVCWIPSLTNSDLHSLFRSSFCLLSPSLMEGFDYPLMEAQAYGLPVLASRIPVHEEFHHGAALFFDPLDYGVSMASQLLRLSREPALWSQLSQAGLRNAASHTTHRQVSELHYLLQGLLP